MDKRPHRTRKAYKVCASSFRVPGVARFLAPLFAVMSVTESKDAAAQADVVSEKGSLHDVPTVGYADSEALDPAHDVSIVGHPWRIKGPALACVLLMTLGSNFASSSISPLKSTLITCQGSVGTS